MIVDVTITFLALELDAVPEPSKAVFKLFMYILDDSSLRAYDVPCRVGCH